MSTDTAIDWAAIKAEIMRFFGIPESLADNGIFAIRALLYRKRGDEIQLLVEITEGEVGLIGDELESFVTDGFTLIPDFFSRLSKPEKAGKGFMAREIRGDLAIVEYLPIDFAAAEERADELARRLLNALLGNYGNRNL